MRAPAAAAMPVIASPLAGVARPQLTVAAEAADEIDRADHPGHRLGGRRDRAKAPIGDALQDDAPAVRPGLRADESDDPLDLGRDRLERGRVVDIGAGAACFRIDLLAELAVADPRHHEHGKAAPRPESHRRQLSPARGIVPLHRIAAVGEHDRGKGAGALRPEMRDEHLAGVLAPVGQAHADRQLARLLVDVFGQRLLAGELLRAAQSPAVGGRSALWPAACWAAASTQPAASSSPRAADRHSPVAFRVMVEPAAPPMPSSPSMPFAKLPIRTNREIR